MSRVDVVIPCYNYGRFLGQCVRSVLCQDGVEVRVLVIDDASSDNTSQIAAELAQQDHRVEFRRHAVNQGHITTYNEGLLEWALAEYSLLLSADDLLIPGSLYRAVTLMNAHREIGFSHGRAIIASQPEVEPSPRQQEANWRILTGEDFIKEACDFGGNPVFTATAVVRTDLQKKLGGYRKELPHSGDMEMWLRFAMHAPVGVVNAQQAYYRRHDRNMSIAYPGLEHFQQLQAAFDIAFDTHGNLLANRDQLRSRSYKMLAEGLICSARMYFDSGDLTQYRQCVNAALDLYPPVQSYRPYLFLRYKQWLGPRAWSLLRPVVQGIRHWVPI